MQVTRQLLTVEKEIISETLQTRLINRDLIVCSPISVTETVDVLNNNVT
jgi:hypothetical protein